MVLKRSQDIIIKSAAIVCFFCIIAALIIIISVGPSIRYEISIYEVYPWYFWFFLIIAISIGQLIILACIFYQNLSRYWVSGLIAIILSDSILLFMPIIRDYHNFGSGDVLTHIGYLKDILNTFNIGTNPYPIDHLYGISIYFFSGISFEQISMLVPVCFSFFFMISMYLLGKKFIKNDKLVLLFILFSTILYFGAYNILFVPNAQALLILPFFIYLILKVERSRNKINFQILLSLIGILFVFFHPLVTMIVIFLLILMRILNIFYIKKIGTVTEIFRGDYLIATIICFFCIWGFNLLNLVRKARPIFQILTGTDESVSQFERYYDLVSTVSVDYFYLIKLTLFTYGQYIILGGLSILCIFIIYYYFFRSGKSISFILFYIIIAVCFFNSISIFFLFSSGALQFTRFLRFSVIISIILISATIYMSIQDYYINLSKLKIITVIFILLITLTCFSIFNLYDSPLIKKQNQQISDSDYFGMSTFFTFRDTSSIIFEQGVSQYRFYDAIYGADITGYNIQLYTETIPIDHFGYNNNNSLSKLYNNTYLLLTDRGKQYYPKVFPEFKERWRFIDSDYLKLNFDNQILKIYQNGNLEIYQIN